MTIKATKIKFMFRALSIILILALVGCSGNGNSGDKTNKEKQLAIDFCECAKQSIAMNKSMQQLQASHQAAEMIKQLKTAGEKAKETFSCCESKMAGIDILKLDEVKLKEETMASCSDMPYKLYDDIIIHLKNR